MTKVCNNNGKLLEEILKREDMSQLTAAENSHIEQCPYCKAELHKLLRLENRLKVYVNTSLEAIPHRKFNLPGKNQLQQPASITQNLVAMLKTWQFATAFATVFLIAGLIIFSNSNRSSRTSAEKTIKVAHSQASESHTKGADLAEKSADGFMIVKSSQKFDFDGYSIETSDAVLMLQPQAVQLKKGHIICNVTSGTAFTVFTATAEVRVRGTSFEVTVFEKDDTHVYVIEGRVEVVDNNNREAIILEAGQQTLISPPAPIMLAPQYHNGNSYTVKDQGFDEPSAKTLEDLIK